MGGEREKQQQQNDERENLPIGLRTVANRKKWSFIYEFSFIDKGH